MNVITQEQAARFAPIVTFHPHERYFPCSIDWLLSHASLRRKDDDFHRSQPTQADLAEFSNDSYYLDVHPAGFGGEPRDGDQVIAPMYVSAQEWDDCIEITYIMLYAYQGGQTCRALKWRDEFNAIVNDFGKHQGDLEWISVQVSKDYRELLSVGFAAHGEVAYYSPDQCVMQDGHPVARVALHGHGSYNGKRQNENDWTYTYQLPGVLGVIDLCADGGASWRPHQHPQEMLKIIGLDQNGQPLSDQQWARFGGRLGIRQVNEFTRATEVDGRPLSSGHEAFSNLVVEAGTWLGKIPGGLREGVGPEGPGARDFVRGLRRQGKRLWRFDVGNTGCDASEIPGLAAYSGNFHLLYRDSGGNGLMHLVSPDGKGWRPARQHHPDATTSSGACPVVHENRLHVLYRDGNGNAIFHLVSSTPDGESLAHAETKNIGLDCVGRPAAASFQGKLCVVARNYEGNGLMYAVKKPGAPWVKGNTGFNTGSAPSLAVFNGLLHAIYRDAEGSGIMHIVSEDGEQWRQAAVYHPDYTTSSSPALLVANDQLHVFFRDGAPHANGVLHLASNDGVHFSPAPPNWFIGMKCRSGPSAALLNNVACVVATNYEGNAIMRAVSY